MINTRRDRQHRSLQLAELLPRLPADFYAVTGGGTTAVIRRARELGVPAEQLLALGDSPLDAVEQALYDQARPAAIVFAIGNVHGIGLQLAERFQESAVVL